MSFLDEIDLYVSSGKGGNGCLSFIKNNSMHLGTPDGGNGGKGGNVYLLGNRNVFNFYYLRFKKNYKANDGCSGGRSRKAGKNGKDLYIDVPLGTVVFDNESNSFLGEVLSHGQSILVAVGGNPGYGSFVFRCNLHKINKSISIGQCSVLRYLHLELKILSDVGLLGVPNAGKSSFLNCISGSKSKVANYEFTTLFPILGVIDKYKDFYISVADMPGIIEKASLGFGLGTTFLKHLLKTRLLLHIVDVSKFFSIKDLITELSVVINELKSFDDAFCFKEIWLILNKIDLVDSLNFELSDFNLIYKLNYKRVFFVSCKKKIGISKLCFNIGEYVNKFNVK